MKTNNDISIKINQLHKNFKVVSGGVDNIKGMITNPFRAMKTHTKVFKVLDGIDVDIMEGDFIGIIGRNGSGKSTLLKLIAGIYHPDKGYVKVKGKLVPFLELGVGFNPELSGRENVFLNGTILGMKRKFLAEKFDEIVDFAEINDYIDMPIKHYSSGMILKLAFSIAIQSDADILILDEILAVGDAIFQKKSIKVIKKLKKEGKTILFVTHGLDTIEKYCNKVLWIDKGKVRFYGDVADGINIYRKYISDVESVQANEARPVDRLGTFDAKVTKVSVKQDGKDLIFSADIDNKKKISKLNLTFGIYKQSGENILSLNNKMDKYEFDLSIKTFNLRIKNHNLMPGEYYLNIALYGDQEDQPYHWQMKIAEFKITDSSIPKYRGLVHFDHEWY